MAGPRLEAIFELVSDEAIFEGVSLSSLSKSTVLINPDLPETEKLKTWYNSEGKDTSMASVGSSLSFTSSKTGLRSMYSDRVFLSHITSDTTMGQDKPVFFSIKVHISFIKHDQTMWYRACKTCNKKVTEAVGSGYWCEACQKNEDNCSLRYIMVVKVSDPSGEAWLSVFNEHAEKIIGCSADELDRIKSERTTCEDATIANVEGEILFSSNKVDGRHSKNKTGLVLFDKRLPLKEQVLNVGRTGETN